LAADDPLHARRKYLVGGSATAKVVVFDTATWKQTSSLVGHEGVIKDLEISPDGTKIASSDAFGLVRIWDLKTGEPLQAIPIGETQVQNVEFLDDRHLLVTPFEGPDMYVMTIDVDELLRIARSRLTRPLTQEECQTYLHVNACPAS
jgi:WD40 repeat protein